MSIPTKQTNQDKAEKIERVRMFQDFRISHYNLNKALDEAKMWVDYENEPAVIVLFGPSGAGKTTLIEHLMEVLIKEHETEMIEDPGHIPVAYVSIMAPNKREFNWKYFYHLANKSLKDPIAGNKVIYRSVENIKGDRNYSDYRTDITELQYLDSLLSNIRNRKLHSMFIDEAQHLAEGATWQNECKQMHHIKTFTEASDSSL